MMENDQVKVTTIFQMEVLLLLKINPMSGYEIQKEILELSGRKPSTGKIYPFLKELREKNYIEVMS